VTEPQADEGIQLHFVPVDLHVHTPASADYRGKRGDDGYLELLATFRDAGVRVVAITDHNTLAGYREIVRLREAVESTFTVLSELADVGEDMTAALEALGEQRALFDSVLVLPGIELDAKPGIHVLAIFNPDQPLEQAAQLLVDAGFPADQQGREDKDSRASLSVDDLLDEIAAIDGIAILAHVDRDKGTYKCLDGSYRAKVFKSDSLSALSYCDPASEAMLSDLLSQRDYRRARPLPMFRCSDYHGDQEVGLKLTFMKLKELSFAAFKELVNEPVGLISQTADPNDRMVIEEIARLKSTVSFPSMAKALESGSCSACALLNQWGGGQLLLGVSVRDGQTSVTGVKAPRAEIEAFVGQCTKSVTPKPSHRLIFFDYGDRTIALVTLVAIGSGRLHLLAESRQAWILADESPVLADASDVAHIVEENVIKRIVAIQRQPIAEARRFASYTPILARSARFFRLARKIEEQSETCLRDWMGDPFFSADGEPAPTATLTNMAVSSHSNGTAHGSVGFAVDAPYRLPGAYLRLTLPSFEAEDFEPGAEPIQRSGPFVVVTPSGGVYFRADTSPCSLLADGSAETFLILRAGKRQEAAHLVRVALWMKSAAAIAYCLMDEMDSVGPGHGVRAAPELYARLPLPSALFDGRADGLDEIADTIAQLEADFLNLPMPESQADLAMLADQHNLAVDRYAYEVEAILASVLGLDEEDAIALDDFLKSRRFYALDGVDAVTGRGIQAQPVY